MARKKLNKEEAVDIEPINEETVATPKLDYRDFDYGDLKLECGRCGETTLIDEGIEHGIQVILPTTDKHELKLTCTNCKNSLRLFFTENLTKKKPEAHDPETANKEEESVQGVSEDN
jgi:hypothetical protein